MANFNWDGDDNPYIGIHDDELFEEDQSVDTFATFALRDQEYYLYKYGDPPTSMTFKSDSSDPEGDRPITSWRWSDFLYVPFHLERGMSSVILDLYSRVATNTTGNADSVDLSLRASLGSLPPLVETLTTGDGTSYGRIRLVLDTSSYDAAPTLSTLKLSVRGRMTPTEEGADFFVRSPGPQPMTVEDFEYEATGPEDAFGPSTALGLPDDSANETKGLRTSVDGPFTSLLAYGSSTAAYTEVEPVNLQGYLGASANLREMSYLQLRSVSISVKWD